jgi:hypothetical protein
VSDIERAQAELRRDLGLRPETRLDVIIFKDGRVYEMRPNGELERVR